MNDEKTTVGIEDLLAMDDQQEFIQESATIKTGTKGNFQPEPTRANNVRPNATRWLFSPFEVINLMNEPTSCGILFLENIVFNRIASIPTYTRKVSQYDLPAGGSSPGAKHDDNDFDRFDRTALMIATELVNKNGDKGVVVIDELTGEEDAAADLNTLLFGEVVECVVDNNNPDFPCPVLPNLLEILQQNVSTTAPRLDGKERTDFVSVANKVRAAIALAIRNCRLRIEDAQKRMLDENNPNRYLSHGEQRCYLALGEEIPNQLPYTTKSAAMRAGNFNPQGLSDAIAAGVVAGMTAKSGLLASPLNQPKDFVSSDTLQALEQSAQADFEVDEGDITDVDGPKKKPAAKVKVGTGAN